MGSHREWTAGLGLELGLVFTRVRVSGRKDMLSLCTRLTHRTRAILIHAAMVGYDQRPDFPVFAPGQHTVQERIEWEVINGAGPLRRAIEAEGMLGDWDEAKAKL